MGGGGEHEGEGRGDDVTGGRAGRWAEGHGAGLGLVTLAGVAYGGQSVLAKLAYDGGADVPTVLAVRFGIAAVAIWAILLRQRATRIVPTARPEGRARLGFALLGILFVTSALFAYRALETLAAGTTTLIVFVYPALVVLWSRLLFREPLTIRRAAALGLALGGCALTVVPSGGLGVGTAASSVGILYALGSALSNSWYATLAGPIGRGATGMAAAAYSVPVTAACFLAGLAAQGGPPAGITAGGWLATVGIGALATLSTTAFLAGVARIGSSRAAIVSTSELATAILLGALLLGEPVTVPAVAGGVCIAAAIVVLALGPSRSGVGAPLPSERLAKIRSASG